LFACSFDENINITTPPREKSPKKKPQDIQEVDEDELHDDDDDDGFHHRNFYLALSIPVLAFGMNENVFPISRSLFFLFF